MRPAALLAFGRSPLAALRAAPLASPALRSALALPLLRRLSAAAPPPPPPPPPSPAGGAPAARREVSEMKSEPLSDASLAVSRFLPHPLYQNEFVDGVEITHREPRDLLEKAAYSTIRVMRFNFDWMSGYSIKKHMDEKMWLRRIIFLETVAGVPGSVGAMLRHLKSLRSMKRDHGWIHTLMGEAENERMHLMTAITLHNPSPIFRGVVWLTQGIFFNFFFAAYLVSPRFCHSLVGYLEEEAVKTYTLLLSEIDKGYLSDWATKPAPAVAKKYWRMPDTATVRDVWAVVRADEAHHRDVNHTFSALRGDEKNPFPPGY